MKKLNTIFSFVLLSFCLLINVSFGATIEANTPYSSNSSAFTTSTDVKPSDLFGYTAQNIAGSVEDYIVNSDDTNLKPILKDLASKGYSKTIIYIELNGSLPTYCINIFPDEFEFDFTFYEKTTTTNGYEYIGLYAPANSYYYKLREDRNTYTSMKITQTSTTDVYNYSNISIPDETNANYGSYHFLEFNGMSVKQTTRSSGLATWDGETYYYKAETEDSETPTMPTNAEIASAVQMFNDNEFDEEKTGKKIGYSDFLVLYDKTTKKYSYICHGMGTSLGQVIVEPNGYYEGYKYDVQWWKFFKDTNSNDYNIIRDYTNYAVYTSDGTLESLTYVGSSNISGLVDKSGPWATSNTIIVYSTKDYPVKYITFSEDGTETYIQNGTIQGDQYTYDENLDITDNNYNPLDNFVTVDPVDTVIGNVNFSEINKTFEENKGILNIENASWLFTANNKLIGYFIGFLSLLIVFLIISRALGG